MDRAELARADARCEVDGEWPETVRVAHRGAPTARPRERSELGRAGGVPRERLLADDVLSRPERGLRERQGPAVHAADEPRYDIPGVAGPRIDHADSDREQRS